MIRLSFLLTTVTISAMRKRESDCSWIVYLYVSSQENCDQGQAIPLISFDDQFLAECHQSC